MPTYTIKATKTFIDKVIIEVCSKTFKTIESAKSYSIIFAKSYIDSDLSADYQFTHSVTTILSTNYPESYRPTTIEFEIVELTTI